MKRVKRTRRNAVAKPARLVGRLSSAERKQFPMATGLFDYFPDALAEIAKISFIGNEKHNAGQPLHHSRGKSNDHADCIARHLVERGTFEEIVIGGVTYRMRHSGAMAWRACALLQEELEQEMDLPLPRGARFD
jgi:dATP/dGTP diphosphohydrolase, N-terminal